MGRSTGFQQLIRLPGMIRLDTTSLSLDAWLERVIASTARSVREVQAMLRIDLGARLLAPWAIHSCLQLGLKVMAGAQIDRCFFQVSE